MDAVKSDFALNRKPQEAVNMASSPISLVALSQVECHGAIKSPSTLATHFEAVAFKCRQCPRMYTHSFGNVRIKHDSGTDVDMAFILHSDGVSAVIRLVVVRECVGLGIIEQDSSSESMRENDCICGA